MEGREKVRKGRTFPKIVLLRVQHIDFVHQDERLRRSLDLQRRLDDLFRLPLRVLPVLPRSLLRKHTEQVPSTSLPRTRPDDMILSDVADVTLDVLRPPFPHAWVNLEHFVAEFVRNGMD
jgi:hypothetical protein